jgi:hypothetical protein
VVTVTTFTEQFGLFKTASACRFMEAQALAYIERTLSLWVNASTP